MTVNDAESESYDFPVHRVRKKGTVNMGVVVMLAINSILIAANYYFHLRQGWSQFDSSTLVLAGMEAFFLYSLYQSTIYSASITIDKNGLKSEFWGERRAW